MVCIVLLTWQGYANGIDSLSTKEGVQKFLLAKLAGGVVLSGKCADISQLKKRRTYQYDYMVQDPLNPDRQIKTLVGFNADDSAKWSMERRNNEQEIDEAKGGEQGQQQATGNTTGEMLHLNDAWDEYD